MDQHFLTPLFAPTSIAIFAGSTDDPEQLTEQARLLHPALRAQRFTGTYRFIDIRATSGTLADLASAKSDLAIIALPFEDIAPAIELASRMDCHAVMVLSAGITAEQAEVLHKVAKQADVHLLGPNGLGIQRPPSQLNASVAGPLARSGSLALVSQSGSLTSSMLDWAANNAVGFSSVVSLGPHSALDIADVLDFLAADRQTHSIIVYMEGINNARRFMSALRSAAPVEGRPPRGRFGRRRRALRHGRGVRHRVRRRRAPRRRRPRPEHRPTVPRRQGTRLQLPATRQTPGNHHQRRRPRRNGRRPRRRPRHPAGDFNR